MRKVYSLLLLFLLATNLYSQHKVKFVVKQQSPIQNDSIYISGTFNNFLAKPEAEYKLKSLGKNEKAITLDLKSGDYEFKFHRGNFDQEACAANGLPELYRKITVKKDTVITITIKNWKDQLPFMPVIEMTKEMIDKNIGFQLSQLNSWYFKQGHNPNWAKKELDTKDWSKFRPSEIEEKHADKNGRREGWLRTIIKVDSSMVDIPINFGFGVYGAGEVYIDGKLIKTYGIASKDKKTYEPFSTTHHVPIQFTLNNKEEHVLAIHAVDYLVPFIDEKHNKGWLFSIWDQKSTDDYTKHVEEEPFFNTIWLSVGSLLCLLFWSLAFQNRKEKNMWLIALTSSSLLAFSICILMPHNVYASKFWVFVCNDYLFFISIKFFYFFSILLVVNLFKRKVTLLLKVILTLILLSCIIDILYQKEMSFLIAVLLTFSIICYYIITSRKSLKGAQWFIVTGVMLTYLLPIIFTVVVFTNSIKINNTIVGLFYTGVFLSLPICLLFYIAFRFKEFINEVQYNTQQVIQLSEEKEQQALNQQKLLEEEVARQTVELRNSIEDLKSTQSQLIQSEKMASLGELTAGIAHEIQNPLNFVNNFSEVNTELIDELSEELEKGNMNEVKALITDIKDNEQKINHHGKRADAIVKGMLQHSRSGSTSKEPTDINKLADEYLRLAYHGLRAKDKSFNAELVTNFSPSLPKANVLTQDIGRVVLNLFTNAFYATHQMQKQSNDAYKPVVSITTSQIDNFIEIKVKDNGIGIPDAIKDKIIQPFFTTKPTGEGTGLGLSLSYDIIVKGHNGKILIDSKENEYTLFTIQIPID